MGAKVEAYYQQLAEIIIDMIPEEWQEVKFYAQEDEEGAQKFFFYYRSPNDWVYYMTIPDLFPVSSSDFRSMRHELSFCISDFKKDYAEEFGESWASFQMSFHSNGKFNIHFSYDKNPLDSMLTKVAWAYEQLGLVPSDDSFDKTLLNEYLEAKAQGKRYPFLEPLKEE